MSSCMAILKMVGSVVILSEEDVSFCSDYFEDTERDQAFLGIENTERRLVKIDPRLPPFFRSGA